MFGLPLGIGFFGTAFSEPRLIKLASGYKAFTLTRAKNPPSFSPMAPDYGIAGTTRWKPSRGARKEPARDEKRAHRISSDESSSLRVLRRLHSAARSAPVAPIVAAMVAGNSEEGLQRQILLSPLGFGSAPQDPGRALRLAALTCAAVRRESASARFATGPSHVIRLDAPVCSRCGSRGRPSGFALPDKIVRS